MSGPDYESVSVYRHIARARDLAGLVHDGQTDKQGRAYIEHPLQVVEFLREHRLPQFKDEVWDWGGPEEPYFAQAAAWLHDTVEDTPLTLGDLLRFGFPTRVIGLVQMLTHLHDEPRRLYYARIRRDPTAVAVKAADLDHNTLPIRLDEVERKVGIETRLRLEDKYAIAYEALGLKPLKGRPKLRRLEKR